MNEGDGINVPSASAPQSLEELETSLTRGFGRLDSQASENFNTLFDVAASVTGMINLLVAKGVLQPSEVYASITEAEQRLKSSMNRRGFVLYPGEEDKRGVVGKKVDCETRLHLCRSVCCALSVALSVQDVEEGQLRWDFGMPYTLRRSENGYCSYLSREGAGCTVHADRPVHCRQYSCEGDARVWRDFDNRIPNDEGIDEILRRSRKVRLKLIDPPSVLRHASSAAHDPDAPSMEPSDPAD